MMEAVTISETLINLHHVATTQKTAIFISVAIRLGSGIDRYSMR
jgi:hypothetical protein